VIQSSTARRRVVALRLNVPGGQKRKKAMHKGRNVQTIALVGLVFLTTMAALGHAHAMGPAAVTMGPDTGAIVFVTGLLGLVSGLGPGPRI
jgi:hypothetical protein